MKHEFFTNEKGHRVLKMSALETTILGGLGICDSCNSQDFKASGYYIAVLNQWFCDNCYEEWKQRAVYYKSDQGFENAKEEQMKKIFS